MLSIVIGGVGLGLLFYWLFGLDRSTRSMVGAWTFVGVLLGLLVGLVVSFAIGSDLPEQRTVLTNQSLETMSLGSEQNSYYVNMMESESCESYIYRSGGSMFSTDSCLKVEKTYDNNVEPFVEKIQVEQTSDWRWLFGISITLPYEEYVFHIPQGSVYVSQMSE